MSYTDDPEDLGLLHESLCLDFTNTVGSHPPRDNDFLSDYKQLVSWGRHIGLLDEARALHIQQAAAQYPDQAEAILRQALIWRETLYRILTAEAAGNKPDGADMETFHEALLQTLPAMRMQREETGHYHWAWSGDEDDLGQMIWPVLWDAAELLKSDTLKHLRECASEGCSWLFLDTSRNHTRRWCDMNSCGNRAKARSHYQRTRKQEAE